MSIKKQIHVLSSAKFLSYFSIVQPILEGINTLAFSQKTLSQIINDSVSEMWGKVEGKRFPYFALYHGLRIPFSVAVQIATVQLSQQLAMSMGDSSKSIEALNKFTPILAASYFSQTVATELLFDTAFKKAVYKPFSNQKDLFFSQSQITQNNSPSKQALLSATDDEAPEVGGEAIDDTVSIKSNEQEDYPVALKRRGACGIL